MPAATALSALPALPTLSALSALPVLPVRPALPDMPASTTRLRAPLPGGNAAGFLDINPEAMSGAAHRLRGLAVGAPAVGPGDGAAPIGANPPTSTAPGTAANEAVTIAVPGVGRFLAAVAAATATQSSRVTELAAYAESAASALDWMAGAVTGTDARSSAALDGMMPA